MTTLPGRVIGAKPAVFARWIFTLLGATTGDQLDDLFPGSGAIARAWAAYTAHPPQTDPSARTSRDASRPARADVSPAADRDASPPPADATDHPRADPRRKASR